MSGYWKLSSKVIGTAISMLEKSNAKLAKGLPKMAATFDEVVLQGAKAGDLQRIISVRDKNGKILKRIIDKQVNGVHEFSTKNWQHLGEIQLGKKLVTRQAINAIPNSIFTYENKFVDGKLVSSIEETFGVHKTRINYGIGITRNETSYLEGGKKSVKGYIGDFQKLKSTNSNIKREASFSYDRLADGFIDPKSLQVSDPIRACYKDIPVDYLPLMTSTNKANAARDMLSIQLRRQKILNRPELKLAEELQKDGIYTTLGTAKVIGTGAIKSVQDKKLAQIKEIAEKLMKNPTSKELADKFGEAVGDAFKAGFKVGIPQIEMATKCSKLGMMDTMAHEVDHVKRFLRSLYATNDLCLINPETMTWHQKAMKNSQLFAEGSKQAQRADAYAQSFLLESNPALAKAAISGKEEDMMAFLFGKKSTLSFEEYKNLICERAANHKGRKEAGILKDKISKLSDWFPSVSWERLFAA